MRSPLIQRRSDDATRAMGELAELALSCDDQAAFRDWLLDRLDHLIGFDLASLHSAHAPQQMDGGGVEPVGDLAGLG